MAREMKLLKLGCVSIDGTHIRASAAKDQNVTYERAGQLREQLRLDVAGLLAQAEAADREDADPQKLPDEIARREKLLRKMDEACTRLEARAKARAEAERAEYERKVAARAEREGSAKGPEPKPPKDTPRARGADQHDRRRCAADAQEQAGKLHAELQCAGRGRHRW